MKLKTGTVWLVQYAIGLIDGRVLLPGSILLVLKEESENSIWHTDVFCPSTGKAKILKSYISRLSPLIVDL